MYEQDYQQSQPYESPVRRQLQSRMLPQAPAAGAPPTSTPPPPSFHYESARDAWMGGPYARTEEGARQWAGEYGINYGGGDVIDLPNGGGLIDILGNFKSGQNVTGTWTPAGGNGPNAGGAGIGAGAAGSAGSGNAFTDQVRQLLLSQLQTMSQPVSMDDPAIAGEIQSQDRMIERERQQRRAAMAERAAANGLLQGGASSGAFDADVASGYEDAAGRKSDVRSQLFGREVQARRGQLTNLLNMALQSGDAESARAIQMQLAAMDNQFRFANLGEQRRQFDDTLGYRQSRDYADDQKFWYGGI
jgi:hypothetical protein